MSSRDISLILLITLIPFCQSSADDTVGGSGRFWLDVDFARFYGNDSLTYVELYYSVAEDKLTYEFAHERFIGGMNIFALLTQEGERVTDKNWTMPHAFQDTSQLSRGQNIVGQTSFALPKGDYLLRVSAYDFYNPRRADTVLLPMRIAGFPSSASSLSDLEICTSIRQVESDSENIFYKNTLEVLPSVSGLFGTAVPTLFYYVETYNLRFLRPSGKYHADVVVYDLGGNEVIRHEKTKNLTNNSSVEVGTINVSQLKGGTYTMLFLLSDSAKKSVRSSAKKFFVYKPGMENVARVRTASGEVAASEFGVMQEGDLDADFAQARYIATDAEVRQYKNFSAIPDEKTRLDAKRRFVLTFWGARKPDASSPDNPFRQEYVSRVREANEKLSGTYKQGWHTERGRVFVMYGPPDAIERVPNSAENVPYEMWTYNEIQGGVLFVFIDRTGLGDWYLVHSTHRNELHDDRWMDQLRK